MRFQCTFCFTIINSDDDAGTKLTCPNCGQNVAVPKSRFETGCVISDFVIQNVIGHGGMATVYLARQLTLDRPVALKVLSEEYFSKDKFQKSFLKEAKAAARLNHPNIIQASKVGEEDGILYYAMEYVQGQTLANKIDVEKTLPLDLALNITQQAAEALHAAWTQENLIHRDVKPDNVMLAEDGYAKIMDLGIAITTDEAETAEVSGTPTYMAPEQFGRERLDCRTDIYSLGVTLFHALCGFPPFDGDSVKEIARKHVFNQLQFPSNDLIYLPQRIKRLISKMMAKEPADRYQDYEELLGDVVALRKRLAPDEDKIPNVHTISFSKYRLQEKMGESPSEIYRRRSDQKKKVAIAKEKSEREAKVKQSKTPWIIVVALGIVIALLGLGIFMVMDDPSTFETTATQFLESDPVYEVTSISELNERAIQCKATIGEIESIMKLLPDAPGKGERRLKEKLAEAKQLLREKYMEIQLDQIHIEREVLTKKSSVLNKKASDAGLDEKSLRDIQKKLKQATDDLKKSQDALASHQAEIAKVKLSLEEEKLANEAAVRKIKEMERLVVSELRGQLDLSLVDLCRERKYKNALNLIETSLENEPRLKAWGAASSQRVNHSKEIYLAVYNTDTKLKGVDISLGTVLEVDRENIRINVEENQRITAMDYQLSDLSARDIVDMAEQVWPGRQREFNQAAMDYALMRGTFQLAYDHAKTDEKARTAVNVFVTSYLKHALADVQKSLKTGNVKLANLRYKLLKDYQLLPAFRSIEDDFRALTQPEKNE